MNSISTFLMFVAVYLSLMLGFMVGNRDGKGFHPDWEQCENFCGPLTQRDMDRGFLGLGETVCTCKADGKQLRY